MATPIAPDTVASLRRRLLDFFDARARDLPWRRTDDPYAILVSEVMLQQTRVDTVIPYFERWLERFPDVEALAAADQADVLKAWEGLGYYRRARNLHGAAVVVRDRFGGRVPATASDLRELPGVGAYTAGAVASIAFGEAAPAVDGNVRRVLSRLFDLPAPSPRELAELAAELVDPGRPGDFNQALMELGATVCTAADPTCGGCPVAESCFALERGAVAERPTPRPRAQVPRQVHVVAVVCAGPASDEPRLLMRQRPPDGLLGGLWEFPTAVVESDEGDRVTAARALAVDLGARLADTDADAPLAVLAVLPDVRHAFTHLHVTYRPVLLEAGGGSVPAHEWANAEKLAALALPTAMRRIASDVWERLGATSRGEVRGVVASAHRKDVPE